MTIEINISCIDITMSLNRNPNIFYGMGRRRRTRRSHGGSILGSINDFLKKHRIISTVGKALGSAGVPYAGMIGKAGVLGYGRKRRRGRPRVRLASPRMIGGRRRRVRRRGGDLKSVLSGAHKFIKEID